MNKRFIRNLLFYIMVIAIALIGIAVCLLLFRKRIEAKNAMKEVDADAL